MSREFPVGSVVTVDDQPAASLISPNTKACYGESTLIDCRSVHHAIVQSAGERLGTQQSAGRDDCCTGEAMED